MRKEVLGVLLAFFAGAWTLVGGAVVLCAKSVSRRFFAGALSLSSGVMVYISFVEIASHSEHQIREGWPGANSGVHFVVAAASMFGGWLISDALGMLIGWIMKKTDKERVVDSSHLETMKEDLHELLSSKLKSLDEGFATTDRPESTGVAGLAEDGLVEMAIAADAETEMTTNLTVAATVTARPTSVSYHHPPTSCSTPSSDSSRNWSGSSNDKSSSCVKWPLWSSRTPTPNNDISDDLFKPQRALESCLSTLKSRLLDLQFNHDQWNHARIGVFTAVCLALHNFPEGIATWTATAVDKKFGFGMATAIAVHNLPEGIAVAVPIYYASRSVVKALLYAGIAGLAEPGGALFAWAVFRNDPSSLAMGVVFAMVGGIMIHVSMSELSPVAWRYEPRGHFASNFFLLGMIIMSSSMALFRFFN